MSKDGIDNIVPQFICTVLIFFVSEVIANFMSYVKLRLQKVRVKFGQFLRRSLIVYMVCTWVIGFTTKVVVCLCVTLKCDNFKKLQHLV